MHRLEVDHLVIDKRCLTSLEYCVHGLHKFRDRTPVRVQGIQLCTDIPTGRGIGENIAPSETVDRLLRVTDHCQSAASDARTRRLYTRLAEVEHTKYLVLQCVGVLKLIDHGDGKLIAQNTRQSRPSLPTQGIVQARQLILIGQSPAK